MTYAVGMKADEPYTAAELATIGKGFGLGDLITDHLGNEFVYVQASGTIALGDVVQFTNAYSAAALTTAASPRGRLCGVAMTALTANQFGFVQVKGINASGANVLTLAAADTRLNTTSTAGTLDDDGTSGAKQIEGIYLSTARGTGTGPAPCVLNYPYVSVTI